MEKHMDVIEILKIVLSWPLIVMVLILLFKKPLVLLIERMVQSDGGKIKVGGILELELKEFAEKGTKVVDDMCRLNYLMAESRLLELEITNGKFSQVFTLEQRECMHKQIEELKKLTNKR
jgi:hypothetical protein